MKRMKYTAPCSMLAAFLALGGPIVALANDEPDVTGSDSSSVTVVIPPAQEKDPKESKPGMDKTMWVEGKEVSNNAVKPGATVNFKLESNIPQGLFKHADEVIEKEGGYTVTGSYTLTFHDKMSDAYEMSEAPVVKINGVTLASEKYTYVNGDEEETPCKFHVSLDLLALYNDGVITDEMIENAAPITVEYDAKFNPADTKGSFTNEVWVDGTDPDSTRDVVEADLYELAITKIKTPEKEDEPRITLSGAEFKLWKDEAKTEQVGEEVTTDEDGIARFGQLPAGTYYLEETKAPANYIRSTKLVEITINGDADVDFVISQDVNNSPAPHTGGEGTTLFTMAGGALLAAGLIMVSVKKKEHKA